MADGIKVYIEIEGRLGDRWAEWFGGMAMTSRDDGAPTSVTTLTGRLADQAALLGILYKLHNLGVDILLVKRGTIAGPQGRGPAG